MSAKTISIDCKIIRETGAAILIEVAGEDYWIPFSQVESVHRAGTKGVDSVVMSEWIAKQKDLL